MVSVIIGVYNSENTIEKAVSSILNQTYSDLEIIISDDGSTDNTHAIIKKLSTLYDNIVVLHTNDNFGAAAARNSCLKVANGEYIAIMDADDYSAPERIAKQVDFLVKYQEYDFVGTKGIFFKDELVNILGCYWYCMNPQKDNFLMTLPFVHASIMFRREVMMHMGGYSTNRNYFRSEDYELLMRLYQAGYSGANINEPLYYIRLDENTYRRRKYHYRINEFIVRFEGFTALGLMPKGLIYALKPLIVGLLPIKLLILLQVKYYKNYK
jgi:glycosyltransferase EpsE